MLLHPDAATLVLTAAVITPLIAAADYFLWRQTRETALAWWGGGALAMTVGTMALFGGSDRTPYAELGTLSLLLSFWLFLRGIHVFQHPIDRRVRPIYRHFVFASAAILLTATLTQPPLLNRALASLLVALVAGHSAFLLVLRHRGEAAASSRFTGAIFALSAALHLGCVVLALINFEAVDWALLHAANILLLIGWNFGFLMLIGQRNQEQISDLANHDELTGVHSRRAFMAMARQLFSVVERQHKPFAVLMLDVDHFKQVNDSYGHAAGDEILKRFAANCMVCLRHSDLLGRIGGEEFCVVLPDTGSEGATEVAERIRAGFEAGETRWQGHHLRATVSIGVALRGAVDAATLEGLMACADEALYQAKNAGRNRVTRVGERATTPTVKLVWDGRYRSGHDVIDGEHEYLFNWANTLLRKLQANAHSPVIAADLRELLHWLSAHFRNEERILAELGWAGLEQHVALHQALEARGAALLVEVLAGDRKCAELLDFIVMEVVARHLARHDAEYFASLKFSAAA